MWLEIESLCTGIYESTKGTCRLSKKIAEVNSYIELCNPFSWIINSFPQMGHFLLSDCNLFPRFKQFRSLSLNCII